MEINIDNPTLQYLFEYALQHCMAIQITSIDPEDFNKTFGIYPDGRSNKIISIEEDVLTDEENCFLIWWKEWNPLEDKYVTKSNHFTKFEFIN